MRYHQIYTNQKHKSTLNKNNGPLITITITQSHDHNNTLIGSKIFKIIPSAATTNTTYNQHVYI